MRNGLIIHDNGDQCWYKDDKLHREDDLPAIIWADSSKFWAINGKCHRENGPADMHVDGKIYWYLNGDAHFFDDWCIKLNKSPKEKAMLMLQYMD